MAETVQNRAVVRFNVSKLGMSRENRSSFAFSHLHTLSVRIPVKFADLCKQISRMKTRSVQDVSGSDVKVPSDTKIFFNESHESRSFLNLVNAAV